MTVRHRRSNPGQGRFIDMKVSEEKSVYSATACARITARLAPPRRREVKSERASMQR